MASRGKRCSKARRVSTSAHRTIGPDRLSSTLARATHQSESTQTRSAEQFAILTGCRWRYNCSAKSLHERCEPRHQFSARDAHLKRADDTRRLLAPGLAQDPADRLADEELAVLEHGVDVAAEPLDIATAGTEASRSARIAARQIQKSSLLAPRSSVRPRSGWRSTRRP
jgi:hypothetical protein